MRALEALLERFAPLPERAEDPLRVERDFAPDELAFARLFDADPPDDLLFVCLLPDDLLLSATAHPSSI